MQPTSLLPEIRRQHSWLSVGLMAAVVLVTPMLARQRPLGHRTFDDAPLRELQRAQPECVLLGDSMLASRIDEDVLSRISGLRCFVFAQPGTSTATWYLMFKNFVAVMEPAPRVVIVLFRERQLTLPLHRAHGPYREKMAPYMRRSEPEIEQLVDRPAHEQLPRLDRLLLGIYPLQRSRDYAQNRLQSLARDLVASSREYLAVRTAVKDVFSTKRLREDNVVDEQADVAGSDLDDDQHEFHASIGRSFLPLMLDLARTRSIQLVFYRVKRRPGPNEQPHKESATAAAYQEALRAYLEEKGALLVDETRDPDVTLDLYGSGDHVSAAMMPRYSELFWRKIGPRIGRTGERPGAER